jgi:hypothetical protein
VVKNLNTPDNSLVDTLEIDSVLHKEGRLSILMVCHETMSALTALVTGCKLFFLLV